MVLKFLLEKEFKQFLRNPFMKRVAIVFPMVIVLIFPLVATFEVHHIQLSVVDLDGSTTSCRLIEEITSTSYFDMVSSPKDYKSALSELEEGKVDIILTIPHHFEQDLTNHRQPSLQMNANSVNGTKGSIGISYLNGSIMDFLKNEFNISQIGPNTINVDYRYNPTLNSKKFMIPALITMIIISLCGFLPALNIVSEKEIGTIEQINVTPINKTTFILAKLIPYWMMGIFVITISFIITWLVYDFLPVGHFIWLYLGSVLFIFVMSGIGLIISNYSATMQQAMFVMFFFVLIFALLCGLFTPISSMPKWAQILSCFIPPRYFVGIMRSTFLKGSGFLMNISNFGILTLFAVIVNIWAIISYRKKS